jgi:hypothetical protein
VGLERLPKACLRYGFLQGSIHPDPLFDQCAFKLRQGHIGLINALEGGDPYLLDKPLDIERVPLFLIFLDGLYARIGETDASSRGRQCVVYSKGHLATPSP